MNPLRAALIVKDSPGTRQRESRNMGYWSYPVPEFTWEHFSIGDQRGISRKHFDLIFHEDAGWGTYTQVGIPIVYMCYDSTLSLDHLRCRQAQANLASLILVDHDDLANFQGLGKPVYRFPYCVNDLIYGPGDARPIDVSFHCGCGASRGQPGGVERSETRAYLDWLCKVRGWSYHSGVLSPVDYGASMGRSRVVVNQPRTPNNRPHRCFDALACGAALLTMPIPKVDGDGLEKGVHYVQWRDHDELAERLAELLTGNAWAKIAAAGRELVVHRHTWHVRATQLRELLAKECGL